MTIDYLPDNDWDGVRENQLLGANGSAALTFFDVAMEK